MERWTCKKYRNKAGMKTQEDYPTKNRGKRRLGDDSISVVGQQM